eukprot:353706-Chlamydomonas_euryale.AAC.12
MASNAGAVFFVRLQYAYSTRTRQASPTGPSSQSPWCLLADVVRTCADRYTRPRGTRRAPVRATDQR